MITEIQTKIKTLESLGVKLKIPTTLSGLIVSDVRLSEAGHLIFVLASGVEIDVGLITGASGVGVPAGGGDGQILAKASADDYDLEFIDPATGGSTPDIATQAEAETGEDNAKMMTPLRTSEAIAALTPKTKTLCLYVGGALAVGTGKFMIPAPYAMTITGVYVAVATAPTGTDLIIDINKNGTTLYTTQANRPTILDGDTSAEAELPDDTSVAENDVISIDIDQVGSTVAGSILMVNIKGEVSA